MSGFIGGGGGSLITEGTYTPTVSQNKCSVSGIYWIQQTTGGLLLSFRARQLYSGSPGPANLTISFLPSGYALDTSRFPGGASGVYGTPIGQGQVDDVSVAARGVLTLAMASTTVAMVQYQSSTQRLEPVTATIPWTPNSGDSILMWGGMIPVVAT